MTKKVIAIISVLKPVDDSRNYEKVARSISNTSKYEINIIGFSTKKIPTDSNISFHPIFNFSRTSLNRIFAPLTLFRKLLKLKPELIIVTCSELLIVTTIYRIIFGSKVIYDVQENYVRNILYSPSYRTLIKLPLAALTRSVELISSLFVDHFLLAEQVYCKQLHFPGSKSIVLDNKAIIGEKSPTAPPLPGEKIRLIYTGTISKHYGIFAAVGLVDVLNQLGVDVQLKVIGYSADNKLYLQLVECTKGKAHIDIIGGDALVPHEQILRELDRAHFCLMPYEGNKSIEGRIPTKLYECLAMEKPIIITSNPAWNELVAQNNAGIIHDFKTEVHKLIPLLYKRYYGNGLAEKYQWHRNEPELLAMVERLLN